MTLKEAYEARAKVWEESKALNDKARDEGRDFDGEENEQWERMQKRIDELTNIIERDEFQAQRSAEYSRPVETPVDDVVPAEDPTVSMVDSAEYRGALFNDYCRDGNQSELRALSAGTDASGGYTVPPQFASELLKKVDDDTVVRGLSTVTTLSAGDSLGFASLETNPDTFTWGGEITTAARDASMAFGSRELVPTLASMEIQVSRKLLRASGINMEAEIQDRMAYVAGIGLETAYCTGDGAGEPLGLFAANDAGITTTQDVTMAGTDLDFDGLMDVCGDIKSGYLANSSWLFHRISIWKHLRQLKDGDGQYLWEMSTQVGNPNRMLGIPIYASEYVPSTYTAGLYVGLLGDFKHYRIVDSLSLSIQRLDELYARTHQIGFIGRLESDAMPTIAEAFRRVKLG